MDMGRTGDIQAFGVLRRRNLEKERRRAEEKKKKKASKAKQKKPEAWVTTQQHPRNKLKPRCILQLWIYGSGSRSILWKADCAVIHFILFSCQLSYRPTAIQDWLKQLQLQ